MGKEINTGFFVSKATNLAILVMLPEELEAIHACMNRIVNGTAHSVSDEEVINAFHTLNKQIPENRTHRLISDPK
jgi:hypothetical protein